MSVGINKIEAQSVFALVTAEKSDAEGDGTLGMNSGELLGVDCVKCAQEVQLTVIIGRRVAQNRHLNVHGATVMGRMGLGE